MVHLADVEWGDVLVDTGDVVVCEGELDGDGVVVKRWSAGALDAEVAARLALGAAGLASAQLLGHGDGWMVLEDLAQTMWRPARAGDLDDSGVARALGRWFAGVHRVVVPGLQRSAEEDLLSGPLGRLLPGCPGVEDDRLTAALAGWLECSAAHDGLVVGAFAPGSVAVVGAGLDAMVTDLESARAGMPAADLVAVRSWLGAAAWSAFEQGYVAAGGTWPCRADWQAATGLSLCLGLAMGELQGRGADPSVLAELAGLLG